jgi:cellulose biosynthesis protein BcsQ
MNTIIIFNFKGGVTKTTTTILAANFLDVYHGKKVALIDADDDQWSSYSVYEEEKKKLVSQYSEKQIDELLKNKKIADIDVYKMYTSEVLEFRKKLIEKNNYDFLFIDLGQRNIEDTFDIFKEADHIIVPYSKDSEEIKKSVVFTNVIKRNFPEKNIKSLVVKIEKNKIDDFMEIRKNLKKRYNNDFYESVILKRDRYPQKRSLIWPLNLAEEKRDFGKGVISFINEFLKQF